MENFKLKNKTVRSKEESDLDRFDTALEKYKEDVSGDDDHKVFISYVEPNNVETHIKIIVRLDQIDDKDLIESMAKDLSDISASLPSKFKDVHVYFKDFSDGIFGLDGYRFLFEYER